jgi:hypothetical protein
MVVNEVEPRTIGRLIWIGPPVERRCILSEHIRRVGSESSQGGESDDEGVYHENVLSDR